MLAPSRRFINPLWRQKISIPSIDNTPSETNTACPRLFAFLFKRSRVFRLLTSSGSSGLMNTRLNCTSPLSLWAPLRTTRRSQAELNFTRIGRLFWSWNLPKRNASSIYISRPAASNNTRERVSRQTPASRLSSIPVMITLRDLSDCPLYQFA